ncbi:MAG: DUF3465 domain-containing protein [Pseudomonadota bacterium]|nr:DUF3465 domain-containing protein [Pseudomonadota bacterium]
MKKPLSAVIVLVLAGLLYLLEGRNLEIGTPVPAEPPAVAAPALDDSALRSAIDARAEDVQVEGQGVVAKILPDDNKGSRHQRFIVRLSDGQTILIAHNIDLAPRVAPLDKGDTVSFAGEYVWNQQGGVVHWTHHDPQGRHVDGWIRRNTQVFQ